MWKLIIKNLWSRRKRNGWLLAELILVSVVTWIIMDPVMVLVHDTSMPLGYDSDRLCKIDLATLDPHASGYDEQATDSASMADNLLRLINKIKNRPEVESVTPLDFAYMNSMGSSSNRYQADTLEVHPFLMSFIVGQHYFETYGIKAAPGSPSAEELSKANYASNDLVVSRNLAEYLLPGQQAVGKQIFSSYQGDTTYYRIRGVVENVRAYTHQRASVICFTPTNRLTANYLSSLLVRLKKGVRMEHFLHEFRPWMIKELRAGNQFARTVVPYDKMISDSLYRTGATNKIRLNIALAVFFLVNLCLGVIGTFWLQTRKRREEAGVMRSFGASPFYILRLLLGEGFVLTTVAFLIGCLGYLQYAVKEGLYDDFNTRVAFLCDDWVSVFSTHFAGVSVIVYFIILVVVSIGIYIPARRISRVNPVDALHDE